MVYLLTGKADPHGYEGESQQTINRGHLQETICCPCHNFHTAHFCIQTNWSLKLYAVHRHFQNLLKAHRPGPHVVLTWHHVAKPLEDSGNNTNLEVRFKGGSKEEKKHFLTQ